MLFINLHKTESGFFFQIKCIKGLVVTFPFAWCQTKMWYNTKSPDRSMLHCIMACTGRWSHWFILLTPSEDSMIFKNTFADIAHASQWSQWPIAGADQNIKTWPHVRCRGGMKISPYIHKSDTVILLSSLGVSCCSSITKWCVPVLKFPKVVHHISAARLGWAGALPQVTCNVPW